MSDLSTLLAELDRLYRLLDSSGLRRIEPLGARRIVSAYPQLREALDSALHATAGVRRLREEIAALRALVARQREALQLLLDCEGDDGWGPDPHRRALRKARAVLAAEVPRG